MADTISTSLELQLRGVREAVTGLNQVGASSRAMAMETEGHAEKFGKLSKVFGKVGGAGKLEFLAVAGIGEAIEGAHGSWSKFSQSLAQTGVYAGAAIAVGLIIDQARSLSEETDKLYESMGQKAPGMLKNWADGLGIVLGIESMNPQMQFVGHADKERKAQAIKQGQSFLGQLKSENSPEVKYNQWLQDNTSTLMGMNIHDREKLEREQWEAIKKSTDAEKERADVLKKMSASLANGEKAGSMYFGGLDAQRPALEKYQRDRNLEGIPTEELAKSLSPSKMAGIIQDYVKSQEAAAELAQKAAEKSKEFANGVATKVAEGESSGQRDFSGERFLSLKRRNESMMGPQIDDRILMAQAKGETDRAEMAAREQLAADDANRAAMAERIKNPRFGGADIVGGAQAYRASNLVAFGNSVNPADKAAAQQLTESQKQSRFQETMARAMETLERGSRSGSLFVIGAGNN